MASDLNIISAIILELIKIVAPDQRKGIAKALDEMEKDHEEEKQKLKQAIKSGDADIINQLIGKYLQ